MLLFCVLLKNVLEMIFLLVVTFISFDKLQMIALTHSIYISAYSFIIIFPLNVGM